jgi:Bacterial extracellular solute-binding proteins, family 5 Middle
LLTANQPGLTETWVPNQQSWLAGDEPVRQAIKHAINSQEIVDTVYGPTYRARTSVLNSTTPGYVDLSSSLTFDPAKAKQLLTDDGWIPGDDGIRVKDGKRLTLNVVASYTDLEIIQQQLKAVGIDYPIRKLDTAGQSKALGGQRLRHLRLDDDPRRPRRSRRAVQLRLVAAGLRQGESVGTGRTVGHPGLDRGSGGASRGDRRHPALCDRQRLGHTHCRPRLDIWGGAVGARSALGCGDQARVL